MRLLACGEFHPKGRQSSELELKKLTGGFLLQGRDLNASAASDLECGTEAKPTPDELEGMLFAEKIAKHVKSNAIVLAKGNRVLGVGAGQMSRVDAVRMAIHKAGDDIAGSVLASDAFFPFPDGVEVAIEAGVKAILQPGGPWGDGEVIAACDAGKAALVFTGERHFRH